MISKKLFPIGIITMYFAIISCNKTPEADFTISKTVFDIEDEISFNNKSLNGYSYQWDFGDGSSTSSEPNPTHKYSTVGTYTVKLTAFSKNEKKRNEVEKTVTIADPRNIFIGNYLGQSVYTFGSNSSMDNNSSKSITKSDSFPNRILIGTYPYAIVTGTSFTIPEQTVPGTADSTKVTSGSGSVNGNSLHFQYSGNFQDSNGSQNFSTTFTGTKQ